MVTISGKEELIAQDVDCAWTPQVDLLMHTVSPECNAYATKDYHKDRTVRVGYGGADLVGACEMLLEDLKKITCEETGTEGKGVVRLYGSSATMASLVRKSLMTRIPVLAPSEILMRTNSGLLLDEVVCSRIGLLAVRAPEHIDATGVYGSLESSNRYVRAREITFNTSDVEIAPKYRDTLVAILSEGGRLVLSFSLAWGTAGGAQESLLKNPRAASDEEAHDRYSAVVSPKYMPTVCVSSEAPALVSRLRLAGYVVEQRPRATAAGSSAAHPDETDAPVSYNGQAGDGAIAASWLRVSTPASIPARPVRFEAVEEIAAEHQAAAASAVGVLPASEEDGARSPGAPRLVMLSTEDYEVEYESQGQHTVSMCFELAREAVSREVQALIRAARALSHQSRGA